MMSQSQSKILLQMVSIYRVIFVSSMNSLQLMEFIGENSSADRHLSLFQMSDPLQAFD